MANDRNAGRKKRFPEGKRKRTMIVVNSDFHKQTIEEIKPILEKYHLKDGETETELIKRIQDMNLAKCEKESLKNK